MRTLIDTVTAEDSSRRLLVYHTDRAGWIVREERSGELVRQLQYQDWHRVERAVLIFTREAGMPRETLAGAPAAD
jgi:hypothetical protein